MLRHRVFDSKLRTIAIFAVAAVFGLLALYAGFAAAANAAVKPSAKTCVQLHKAKLLSPKIPTGSSANGKVALYNYGTSYTPTCAGNSTPQHWGMVLFNATNQSITGIIVVVHASMATGSDHSPQFEGPRVYFDDQDGPYPCTSLPATLERNAICPVQNYTLAAGHGIQLGVSFYSDTNAAGTLSMTVTYSGGRTQPIKTGQIVAR